MPKELPRSFDIAIRRTTIFDGTGAPRFVGDVGIIGDRIVAVGDLASSPAAREIDGSSFAAAPGFIDVHTHDDNALLVKPNMSAKTTQGVTSVITGNCGVSLAPLVHDEPPAPLDLLGGQGSYRYPRFSDYVAELEHRPPSVNAALMIGHSTLRVATIVDIGRPATDSEVQAMRVHVREALDCGAVGFSTGLFYPTNRAATIDEVVGVLQELAGTGAVYATHMRDEADGVEESLDESFETARRAGVPLVISHHKCMGKKNFGRSRETLKKIDEARQHQPIGLDVYPYVAGSTVLLPELIEQALRIRVSWSTPYPELAGADLDGIASRWGVSQREALDRLRPGGGIYFMMEEADVERIMAYPNTMIGSDGLPHDRFPHPRLWGTFPRVLGHYARDRGLLTLEDAIRRMTSLPSQQFGIEDRGIIRVGAYADLVLFDPTTVSDRATFDDPERPAIGIELVMVNGTPVIDAGEPTGARPGRVLRRKRTV